MHQYRIYVNDKLRRNGELWCTTCDVFVESVPLRSPDKYDLILQAVNGHNLPRISWRAA